MFVASPTLSLSRVRSEWVCAVEPSRMSQDFSFSFCWEPACPSYTVFLGWDVANKILSVSCHHSCTTAVTNTSLVISLFRSTYGRKYADRTKPDFDVIFFSFLRPIYNDLELWNSKNWHSFWTNTNGRVCVILLFGPKGKDIRDWEIDKLPPSSSSSSLS